MESIPRKYDRRYVPSPQRFARVMELLQKNQDEMVTVVQQVATLKSELNEADDPTLLFRLGSYFYEYYLMVEDILLAVAALTDQWVPGSLDWHERLLKLLKKPVEEARPPVLSTNTAELLEDYLYFYLFFHKHCSSLSSSKVKMLSDNLEKTHNRVINDLSKFYRVLKILNKS